MEASSLLIQRGVGGPRVLEQLHSQAAFPRLYLHDQRESGELKQVPNGLGESNCLGLKI